MAKAEDKYNSYAIARDWYDVMVNYGVESIGFKNQEEKNKFLFIGILSFETDQITSIAEGEKLFKEYQSHIGRDEFNKILTLIGQDLIFTEYGVELKQNLVKFHKKRWISYSLMLQTASRSAQSLLYYDYWYRYGKKNADKTNEWITHLKLAYGEDALLQAFSVLDTIEFESKPEKWPYIYSINPYKSYGNNFYSPIDIVQAYLRKNYIFGTINYQAMTRDDDGYDSINDMDQEILNAHKDELESMLEKFEKEDKMYSNGSYQTYDYVLKLLNPDLIDFSNKKYYKLNSSHWRGGTFYMTHKDFMKMNYSEDDVTTLTLYGDMTNGDIIAPNQWKDHRSSYSYFFNSLTSQALCEINRKNVSEIIVNVYKGQDLYAVLKLSADNDYRILTFEKDGEITKEDISKYIWPEYRNCMYIEND